MIYGIIHRILFRKGEILTILSDESFEKRFGKNAFSSNKINFDIKSDRLTKKFPSYDI